MLYDHVAPTDVALRVRTRYALRNLVLKDLEFMEDTDSCDYCKSTPMGHAPNCVFMEAVEQIYAEKLPSAEALHRALGDLLKADCELLGDSEYICPYCDEVDDHAEDCVYCIAIQEYVED